MMLNAPLVILAGGLGTRLREETEFRPKPMVEIGGKPIIWHIMKYYSSWGINEFIICTGYKGEVIKDYFLNYRANQSDITVQLGGKSDLLIHHVAEEDWKVTIVDTGSLTPTGGRLSKIADYIRTDDFLCTYGDGVANVDISKVYDLHFSNSSIATLTAVKPMSRFGVLDIGRDGKVIKFKEKPRMDTWINGGYFVFSKEIFSYLDHNSTLEQEPLSEISRMGLLSASQHEGFWQPMDTLREAELLNAIWARGEAEWKVW
jgi:glucose-1-phosphate cytidylyltransferase